MASVYNLIGNASNLSREIIRENGRLEMPIKIRYFAALTIQRCFQGYKVRCMIRYWHRMATVIQKIVRGWLVRWHRVDYLKLYLARMETRDLNNSARKIQAFWRGYQVRKTLPMPIKEIVKRRQLTEAQSSSMRDFIRQKFQALRLHGRRSSVSIAQDVDQNTLGEECKRWVLFILFKTHHLTRTYCKEGIYSVHGSNRLSQFEYWMNSLPMQRYMQELRQLYNANYTDEQIIEYIFQDKKIQHYEHLYRSRDKSRETKRPTTCLDDKSIHEKPFDLYKPPKKKPYERLIVNMDKYSPLKTELLRSFSEFSLDFDVFSRKPGEAPTHPPPYHIDFWNVTCKVHYPPDD